MKRRTFLYGGMGALAACTQPATEGTAPSRSEERFRWRMVTSWPPNFPGHGVSANRLARRIEQLSDGRIEIQIFAAGELVPAFEVLDAVSRGTIELGHSAPIYWRGKLPAAQVFGSIPFGMLADEFNAWIYHGGGMELWREAYGAQNVVPFLAGQTGPQMGGWFNREINSVDDLVGLKMRIPGLGGEVMQRAGVLPVNLPGSEIYTALQTGAIDATEWVGPYNDLAFGLHEAARYYYYPGWQEPSGALELLVSADAYASLPEDLQQIIATACMAEADYVFAEFNVRNNQALKTLVDEHGVQLRRFPNDVLAALRRYSAEVMEELAAGDPAIARVYEAYTSFAENIAPWMAVSRRAHIEARDAV
jgi:TRAP-type mannitol/chloroaromatic compound transport system substrate-binding protein